MATPIPDFPPGYVEENISRRVLIAAYLFIPLEIVVVGLRCLTRWRFAGTWGTDDYFMAPALLFCIGICIIGIGELTPLISAAFTQLLTRGSSPSVEVHIAGIGRHLLVLLYGGETEKAVNWVKCGYAIEQVYFVAVALPKLSVLASYLRIFVEKKHRIATYITGGFVVVIAFIGVVTSLASCRPFSARWDFTLVDTHCINSAHFWQGMAFPNIATDLFMLVLPWPVLWRLQLPRRQKLALIGVFLLGSFGMVASIIRLTATFRFDSLSDGTYVSADICVWSIVEPGCYLIASCLPALRPLFTSMKKVVTSSFSGKSKTTGSYGAQNTGESEAYIELV